MDNQAARSKMNPWFILIIILLATTAAPLAMFKVPTVMPNIMAEFNLNAAQGGFVFSFFSLIPIFISIPAGIIVAKFGNWKLGLIALICLVIGSLIGVYSNSLTPMLMSRAIEGFAMTMLATIGPNIVAQLFSPEQRGKAMGIFLCYIALGQTVMFNAAPSIIASFGWRGVWWFTAIYSLLFIILWFLFLRNVDSPTNQATGEAAEKLPFGQVIKNMDIWIITLVFCMFMVSLQGVMIFLPTFLAKVKGMEMGTATQLSGLIGLIGLFTLVLAGTLSDKLKSRKWLTVVLMIISGLVYASIPNFPASIVIAIVLVGIFPNMVPPVIFTGASEVVDDPRTMGLAMGILTTGQFIGLFMSTLLFGMFVDTLGWTQAYYFAAAVSIFGGLLMIGVRKISR